MAVTAKRMARGLDVSKWEDYCSKFPDVFYEVIECGSGGEFIEISGTKCDALILTPSAYSLPVRPRLIVDPRGNIALLHVLGNIIDICQDFDNSGYEFVKKLSASGGYRFCRQFSEQFAYNNNQVFIINGNDPEASMQTPDCMVWFQPKGKGNKGKKNNNICPNCQKRLKNKAESLLISKKSPITSCEVVSVDLNYSPSHNFTERALKSEKKSNICEEGDASNHTNVSPKLSKGEVQESTPVSSRGEKRKKCDQSSAISCKKVQKDRNVSRSKVEGGCDGKDANSPEAALKSLVHPKDITKFFQDHWEKTPLILNHADSSAAKEFLSQLPFTKDDLIQLLKQENIQYDVDVNFCRYKGGVRENLNKNGRVTVREFLTLFDDKHATVQFHQPQRYVKQLWSLLERLECYFGCLVGSNVYITPRGSQGLAPHYDDVEVFVCQIEGEKHWRLYKPPFELPTDYSKDLSQDEIGDPTHDFILKPGDVLYMPRGTIHQADTPKTSPCHSTHITISTYQKHTWGDYLSTVMMRWMEKAMDSSVLWRQGLPIGFLFDQQPCKITLKDLFAQLSKVKPLQSHDLLKDFMESRLPPFVHDQKKKKKKSSAPNSEPDGPSPTLSSWISLKYPDHVAFVVVEDEDDDNESDEEEAESLSEYVILYTSVFNDRKAHMMGASSEGLELSSLKFPVHYAKALQQLRRNRGKPLRVSDLDLMLDEEKLKLCVGLWSLHLLTVS